MNGVTERYLIRLTVAMDRIRR